MGIVQPCDTIFRVVLPAPATTATVVAQVNTGLAPSTSFWYILTDKFGREYTKQIETDAEGSFQLLIADFPPALFSPYSGSFLLQVKSTLQDAAPQPLKFCDVTYDTILLEFASFPGNPPAIIDCH